MKVTFIPDFFQNKVKRAIKQYKIADDSTSQITHKIFDNSLHIR